MSASDLTRRALLRGAAGTLGGIGLTPLLGAQSGGAHHAPRAKHVIYIHMVGAPSHLDLFEPKPELTRRDGELCPEAFFEGKQLAFIRERPNLLGTPTAESKYAFTRSGESGAPISNLLPGLQRVADRLCFVRTLHTDHFNHAPAQLYQLTGFERFGRPSIGSWMNYGLGTPNADLPGFVALISGQVLGAGNAAWGAGFLPTDLQGVEFRSQGEPVLFLGDPKGMQRSERAATVEAITALNAARQEVVGDPDIDARSAQYALAYRMQESVPELVDLASEPESVREQYGAQPGKRSFANHCLLARRLVERGVRFVQLFDEGWDHHGSIFGSLERKTKQVDRPIAALIEDLEQRGMLDETLVVWATEFGRTPMGQGSDGNGGTRKSIGRDHHKEAFTIWLAGGGVNGGHSVGETDELGYGIVREPVHVHDLNATILHLMGVDHERLTYRYQGRRFRLTDVHGRVVPGMLG